VSANQAPLAREAVENTSKSSELVFPFGHPNLSPRVGADGPRRAFVLMAHGDAVWATWAPHRAKTWASIPIAAEPASGWNGDSTWDEIERWKATVRPASAWGPIWSQRIRSGDAVLWVESQVLQPLDLQRDEVWFSACLPQFFLTAPPDPLLESVYERRRRRWKVPAARLPQRPPDAELVARTLATEAERLRVELRQCRPERVIAMGEAAWRVLRELLDAPPDERGEYGHPQAATFEGRALEAFAFVESLWRIPHYRPEERRDALVPAVHQAWLEWAFAQPRRHPHPPCPACGARWVLPLSFGHATAATLRRMGALWYGGNRGWLSANAPNWICMRCEHAFVDVEGSKAYRWVTERVERGIRLRMVADD
jgi:hypothetical protein